MARHIEDFQRPCRKATLHGDIGVERTRDRRELWAGRQQWCNQRLVAVEQKLDVGMALERDLGTRHKHRWAVVSSHRVERNTNFLRHGSA